MLAILQSCYSAYLDFGNDHLHELRPNLASKASTIESKLGVSASMPTVNPFSFSVAEVFTGTPGVYVSVDDTVKGFAEILDGQHDDVAEGNFYMKGAIDTVEKG